MRIKIIILLVLTALFSTPIYAQLDSNTKAKLYYTEAQKTYEQGDFESCLEYLIKAEHALGTVVARTLALKIKTQFNLGNFIEAKELMNAYTNDYMDNATQELNDEVLAMYINIEEAVEQMDKREDDLFAEAKRAESSYKMESYLDEFPEGKYVEEARKLVKKYKSYEEYEETLEDFIMAFEGEHDYSWRAYNRMHQRYFNESREITYKYNDDYNPPYSGELSIEFEVVAEGFGDYSELYKPSYLDYFRVTINDYTREHSSVGYIEKFVRENQKKFKIWYLEIDDRKFMLEKYAAEDAKKAYNKLINNDLWKAGFEMER